MVVAVKLYAQTENQHIIIIVRKSQFSENIDNIMSLISKNNEKIKFFAHSMT